MIEIVQLQKYLSILVELLRFYKSVHNEYTVRQAMGQPMNIDYKIFDTINPNPDHKFLDTKILESKDPKLLCKEITRLEKIIKELPSIIKLPDTEMRAFIENQSQ